MPLLEVRDLVKEFRRPRLWGPGASVRAVDRVSLTVEAGEIFGLVGESGSGKTTTGRCLLRLVEPTSGTIRFKDQDVLALSREALRAVRRDMQMVFQDPIASLTPHLCVGTLVEEPLVIHRIGTRSERRDRVADLFRLVGLDPGQMHRYPHEFSGGQRQRIGLARALALNPSLVIADEPVSALDVTVQNQIVSLLLELQATLGLTYLLIAHDLRLVERICTRVAVMHRGRVVEMGSTRTLFQSPAHPYTRALLSAMPVADPSVTPARVEWAGAGTDAPLRLVADGHWAAV